ncbi:PH domain-like protein [Yamadazyma tenuis ATCC 10573]|uniref:PH domain-like protein n=1 Tax=Candida tenuis (strain ATCC 10573 / BCRC 21748 / CBS 615 / JCM 9827 / NBRC 10315 / NRRL Y-1498 / VKM Y-70) TaxID=590646 RepID=G3B3Y5_CANTC|nr:PH domain-like protein [Yamadazyma tenuis ATCC 10573]EGV63890.1 PH domain-like protein [Yamadazyma tenuis ATCC 10573]
MSTPQDDYLLLIEPNPVSPPEYNSLPPGGCPKFPIFHHEDVPHGLHNGLPEYTPSIYKIGPISRKVEWISPYEASTSRSWKNYIIELNSTQLNLYSVPSNLESHMLGFQIDDYGSHPPVKVSQDDDFYALNSTLSNRYDYEFFNYCKRMKAVKKLVRSYSLQHCRIGLASDYKKKTNVLRVRIESEQILLAFQNTKDLIDWNLALNIGKDLALDLIDRELPKYRTVPRRRRRRADGLSEPLFVNYDSVASTYNRSRSHSEPTNLINKMSRLKLRLRRDSSVNLSTSTVNSSASSILANSNSNSVLSMNTLSSVPQSDLTSIEPSSIEPSGIEDNDNDDDLSDYNSDYDDDFDNDNDDSELERPRAMKPRVSKSKSEEKRWSPNPENQTIRKYYKNSLRCIKPLNFDDTWTNLYVYLQSFSIQSFESPFKAYHYQSANLIGEKSA